MLSWTKHGHRLALVGYLLVAVVIIGGLSWSTVLGLRLQLSERETYRARDRERDLRLALRRLDSVVQTAVARESARPASDYKTFYPAPAIWVMDGSSARPGQVIRRSPLLDGWPEPWIIGHFMVSARSDWMSPEVPSEDWLALPGQYIPTSDSLPAIRMLSALRRTLTPDKLGMLLVEARMRDRPTWLVGEAPHTAEFVRRRKQAEDTLRRPPEVCERRSMAMSLLQTNSIIQPDEDPGEPGQDGDADQNEMPVQPSHLTGVWLQLDKQGDLDLAFVRTVGVEDDLIYQGFVIDWPALREVLLENIHDLFPDAELVPLTSEPSDELEAMMTYVPVQLDVPEPPALTLASTFAWTPMHAGLLVAWIASLIVLIAAGFGVRALLALAERRSQFAYAISHELRTPLTTFRLYTDMLRENLVSPERRQEYIETLNQEAQRLSHLVGGVLEYAQLEHHAVQSTSEHISVEDLLSLVRQRYKARCAESERDLVIEPDGVADAACHTDTELSLQILGTLIDNACKYARDASDPRVIVSAGADGPGRVNIDVRDFGPGVERRDRRRIFKPFRRGKWTGATPGTGLGLALAHRWAEILGGRLDLIDSGQQQAGACFRLSLPVDAAPAPSQEAT